jgi:hypothetical protein
VRVLAFIKKHLRVGSISISKDFATFRVRKAKHLDQFLFPMFERFPLQTVKDFHRKRVQLATALMLDSDPRGSTQQKREYIALLKSMRAPEELEWWSRGSHGSMTCGRFVHDDWLIGFFEGATSTFSIIKKDTTRFVCCFEITQKQNRPILESIRRRFSIPAQVRWNTSKEAYSLKTTNLAALHRINEFVRGRFKAPCVSLEYKLWSKALYYQSAGVGVYRTTDPRKEAPQGPLRDRRKAPCLFLGRGHLALDRALRKVEQIQSIMQRLKNRNKRSLLVQGLD